MMPSSILAVSHLHEFCLVGQLIDDRGRILFGNYPRAFIPIEEWSYLPCMVEPCVFCKLSSMSQRLTTEAHQRARNDRGWIYDRFR